MPGQNTVSVRQWPGPTFTTDDFRPAERFDAFNEEFARKVMQLDVWREDKGPFHGDVGTRLIGPLVCASMTTSPLRAARTTARMKDGDDCIVLAIQMSGHALIEQHDVIADSLVDFAALTSNADAGGGRFRGKQLAIRIPRVLLASYLAPSHSFAPRVIRRNSQLAHLLGGYVGSFLGLAPSVDREIGDTVGRHIVELVALAMGATGEASEIIESGGLRAARRRAVFAEIARGFAQPDFSPAQVAGVVAISERYLRQLLEETGTTFTDLVLEHRLDHARQILVKASLAHMRITDIAYDSGFSDLSYFNRAFRRRYSATPRDVRAEALGL